MNAPKQPFRLDSEDLQSKTWRKLNDYLSERLTKLREQNDGDLSDADTAKLRGRIAELRLILSLGKDFDRPG